MALTFCEIIENVTGYYLNDYLLNFRIFPEEKNDFFLQKKRLKSA